MCGVRRVVLVAWVYGTEELVKVRMTDGAVVGGIFTCNDLKGERESEAKSEAKSEIRVEEIVRAKDE